MASPARDMPAIQVSQSSQNADEAALMQASAVSPPSGNGANFSTQAIQASSHKYRLPFGKHKGKTLSEVPSDYISWLKNKSDLYKADKTLQDAVEHHLTTAGSNDALSTPAPSQPYTVSSQGPPSTALAFTIAEGPYVLTFGKHKGRTLDEVPAEYIAWLKTGNIYNTNEALQKAVDAWEKTPRVYKLCFGKYKGCALAEVPPTYINWLNENDAPEGHEDLKKALKEHRKQDTSAQIARVTDGDLTGATGAPRKKKGFVVPDEVTGDYRRYYYGGDRNGGQMWIGRHDATRYFGAEPTAMAAAGLRTHHNGQRFWLHQVFAYAKHHGTTKDETPTKALNKFKAKNYNNPGGQRTHRTQPRSSRW